MGLPSSVLHSSAVLLFVAFTGFHERNGTFLISQLGHCFFKSSAAYPSGYERIIDGRCDRQGRGSKLTHVILLCCLKDTL